MSCEGYTNIELLIKEERINIILGRTYTENLNKLEAKIFFIEMRLLHHLVTKLRSEEHTSELSHSGESRMPSSA